MATKMNAQEARWRAEEDASTMARYQEIMSDKKRMNAAIKMANQRADELQKRANAMRTAAGKNRK